MVKSLTITYGFILLIVGLFLFSGNTTHSKTIESNKINSYLLLDKSNFINNKIISEIKNQNVASTLLESISKLSFTDFYVLIPPKEDRNHYRNNFRFTTLKI